MSTISFTLGRGQTEFSTTMNSPGTNALDSGDVQISWNQNAGGTPWDVAQLMTTIEMIVKAIDSNRSVWQGK
jgi:hypothetical protein